MRIKLLGVMICYSTCLSAQVAFRHSQSIDVIANGAPLMMAWAGGLNSAQYNTIDLDSDGVEDLVVFDRTSNKISTYLASEGKYRYVPQYEYFFPENLRGWVVLRDYDCDGKKDIFTRGSFGVDVYHNISGDFPAWEIAFEPLTTKGTGSIINLNINASDIPAIEDVDGDGDLDILMFGFNGGGLQFHKNFSIERTGDCGGLDLERVTSNWGNFKECGCDTFAFNGEDCPPQGGRLQHVGGKSLLVYDMDDDGDMEVVLGEEDCQSLWLLENKGDKTTPFIDGFVPFPNGENPASFNSFPAAFLLDVDFDGKRDLLVSPNISANSIFSPTDFERSSWYYQNQSTDNTPDFRFQSRDFIQDVMLDQGSNSSVAFVDEDGDGDLDMLMTSHGVVSQSGLYRSHIYLYRNIGTKAVPAFELVDEDYLSISTSSFAQTDMKIQFADINSDGTQDLIIQMVIATSSTPAIYFIPNTSINRLDFSGQQAQFINLSILSIDNPYFYDINGDGLTDLLLGKSNGNIEYYRNAGAGQVPDYRLETTTFYGKDRSFTNRNIIPAIGDLNNDSNPELITTDDRGELNIYENFLNNLDNPLPATNEIYFNTLNTSLSKSRLGVWARPVIVDLYNSGTPVIVFGMAQGGLQVLENVDALPPGFGGEGDLLTIAPNPGTISSNNGVVEITTKEPLSVRIISVLGKEVISPRNISPTTSLKISINDLNSGLYIALAERNGKLLDNAKFIIMD